MQPTSTAPRRPLWLRLPLIIFGMVPLVSVHLALFAIPYVEFTVWSFVAIVVVTRIAGFGVTIGYHRYFSHRSFKTTRWFHFLLGCAACCSLQRGPLWWAIYHRVHHKHSDGPGDPHSPVERGFLHAHMGWLFTSDQTAPNWSVVRDLTKYPELVWLERLWFVPGLLMAAACFALLGWSGLIYGYCLSVVLIFQFTFAVNSVGHMWGPQRFATGEGSRNNLILGVLTMGDGWHNNHHRAPYSARHGFAWYEVDMSYKLIKLLARLGLVWGIKEPPPELLAGGAEPAAGKAGPSEPAPAAPAIESA